MSFEENISKIRNSCKRGLDNLDKMISDFLPAESIIRDEAEDTNTVYVPRKANMHYPNIFLRTNVSTACKNYLHQNIETRDYSEAVGILLDELEQLEIDDTSDRIDADFECDADTLNNLIRDRFGMN